VTIKASVGFSPPLSAQLIVNPTSGPTPILSVTKSHTGNFTQGQSGQYTVVVSDGANAGPTSGTVTVTDTLPSGLTFPANAASGANWSCSNTTSTATCTRSDPLNAGSSYPQIALAVNADANAPSQVTNQVQVSGGGSPSAGASDPTNIQSTNNGVPTITAITPNQVAAGTASQTLVITGTNFSGSSQVNFGTSVYFINAGGTQTQISITVQAGDLASPGIVPVTVTNTPPGGGTSNMLPLTISPNYAQGPILDPGNITAIDEVGDTVVAANGVTATVFVRVNGAWTQAAALTDTDMNPNLQQGAVSAAISGDGSTIVLGSCNNNVSLGHAFVYEKPSGGWSAAPNPMSPTAQLQPSNEASRLRIGTSVATDLVGNHVALGAPCDYTTGSLQCGFVYVWVKPGAHWTDSIHENAVLQHQLPDLTMEPTLGFSLAMDRQGVTIATGAPGIGNAKGAVDIFAQPSGGWATTSTPDVILVPTDTGNSDRFGYSVAMNGVGDTIVAGAPSHPACSPKPCSPDGPGAAYVFENTQGWLQKAELAASDGQNGDDFGWSVSLSDEETVAVGASHFSNSTAGAAYVFIWPTSQNQLQKLTAASDTDIHGNTVVPSAFFGASVSLANGASTLAVGGSATVGGKAGVPVTFVF
jgi:uncharacterized repeat protein (TIGR01451 family)